MPDLARETFDIDRKSTRTGFFKLEIDSTLPRVKV
jgi:hypothetical protein